MPRSAREYWRRKRQEDEVFWWPPRQRTPRITNVPDVGRCVGILASKNYPDLRLVRHYVRRMPLSVVMIGDEHPAEKCASSEAEKRGMPVERIAFKTLIIPTKKGQKLQFSPNGRANRVMKRIVSNCGRVVVFWDGTRDSTFRALWLARQNKREVLLVTPYDEDPGSMHPVREAWNALRPALAPVVFERDGYACRECGGIDRLEIDHVFPIILGGSNELDNLQTLCRSCNSRKGARV